MTYIKIFNVIKIIYIYNNYHNQALVNIKGCFEIPQILNPYEMVGKIEIIILKVQVCRRINAIAIKRPSFYEMRFYGKFIKTLHH
ncbi:unnamed protein product [Blepharisma stoltei]|uniref:Uncharacterized protein n=1 Tax=Blepharisma stoltei TaxID=1481888 RepID=A0AAU9INF1_9CILI|nr:unnamed protein product [Blepharisma stoltei]